jgi:hypothetical protein
MKKIIVILVALILVACSSAGRRIDMKYVSYIKKGVTTEQRILERLGKPYSTITSSSGSRVHTYMHSKSKVKASTFIPVVGLFTGGVNTKSTVLRITIDQQTGLVSDWEYGESDTRGLLNTIKH